MDVIITILNNKKCSVVTSLEIENKVYNKLSFKQAGIEFTPLFKRGLIDGIKRLYNIKKHTFDLGLLDNVCDYIRSLNLTFEIKDERPSIKINKPLNIDHNLKKINMIPRDHQIRIRDLALTHKKGIVRSATGSGKTLSTALMTAQLNRPTIIYVIGLDLLNQFHDLFSKVFDEEIGYIGNGVCDIKRINIASIWSIGSALKCKKIVSDDEFDLKEKSLKDEQKLSVIEMLKSTEVHLFDESHIITCSTIEEIYKVIDPMYMFGFSGTPFKGDNDLLVESFLGRQLINVSAGELIEKGLLVSPIIKFIDVPKRYDINFNSKYLEIYKKYIVENEVRNQLIVDNTKKLIDKGYTPLVLFKQISHGNILCKMFDEIGIKYEYLSGKDKLSVREDAKKRLMNGETKLLIASTVADIGIDIPVLSALVLGSGGKSYVRCVQRAGRILRLSPGKKHAAIVDFADDCRYLKGHSATRLKIYKSEDGFKVIKSNKMK